MIPYLGQSILINGTEFAWKEGYEYGFATFEELPNIYVESSEHIPAPSVDVSKINATIMKEDNDEDKEVELSLSIKELIDVQNNDTLCSTKLKLINDKKVPSDKYFIVDNGLLHKVVREDDKLFHALVVP